MKRTSRIFTFALIMAAFCAGLCAQPLPVEKAVLTSPPKVPPPITRSHPVKVVIEMEVIEKVMRLADEVEYMFWTFGGTVPGSFIRIREGDQVEFNLSNHPDNKLPHNIDLHAVTGQGGGAEGSFTAPGHTTRFNFKALNPGLFIYHCATQPVGMHIANGMYGLILVEPKNGMPKVDREYYILQSEFYTAGSFGEPGLQGFSMEKAIKEDADYVVFNGSVGALAGANAIPAKVGERVRLYVGNGGPNLASSFHVIGEIFDWVNHEGGSTVNRNVQTTTIPPGGAAMVEFKLDVPGTFILVDHAIFRAFNKGAIGMIKAEGPENHEIYSGKIRDDVYKAAVNVPDGPQAIVPVDQPKGNLTLNESMERGKKIYNASCFACHQADGRGLAGVFPPLAGSDYLMQNPDRAADIILRGMHGQVTVNGKNYNQVMPPQNLSDEDSANVLNFVLNSWGNKHDTQYTAERIRQIRANPVKR